MNNRNLGSWCPWPMAPLLVAATIGFLTTTTGFFSGTTITNMILGRTETIIEELKAPLRVYGWNNNGLILDDGVVAPLQGIKELPDQSLALTRALQYGVERAPDGRTYGLLKIHHACGNDPVSLHIARVDLVRLLQFLGEAPLPEELEDTLDPLRKSDRFTEHGWRDGEYGAYRLWCEFLSTLD